MPHIRVNLDTVATGNQDNLRGCRGIVCGHKLIPLQRSPDLGAQLLECVCVCVGLLVPGTLKSTACFIYQTVTI